MGVVLITNTKNIEIDAVAWDDVNTGRYQHLMQTCKDFGDMVEIYSILYGINYDVLSACRDQSIIGPLSVATQFIAEDLHDIKKPEYLTVFGQAYKIPKNLEDLTIGQMMQLKQHAEKAKSMECIISLAVAIWIQPIIDESGFSMKRALEIEEDIKFIPITKTFAIGFFYLRKLNKHGHYLVNAWHLLKRFKPKQIRKLLSLRGLNAFKHLQI